MQENPGRVPVVPFCHVNSLEYLYFTQRTLMKNFNVVFLFKCPIILGPKYSSA